jgi:hypothetical protein
MRTSFHSHTCPQHDCSGVVLVESCIARTRSNYQIITTRIHPISYDRSPYYYMRRCCLGVLGSAWRVAEIDGKDTSLSSEAANGPIAWHLCTHDYSVNDDNQTSKLSRKRCHPQTCDTTMQVLIDGPNAHSVYYSAIFSRTHCHQQRCILRHRSS